MNTTQPLGAPFDERTGLPQGALDDLKRRLLDASLLQAPSGAYVFKLLPFGMCSVCGRLPGLVAIADHANSNSLSAFARGGTVFGICRACAAQALAQFQEHDVRVFVEG